MKKVIFIFISISLLFLLFCKPDAKEEKVEQIKKTELEDKIYSLLYPLLTKEEGNPLYEPPPVGLSPDEMKKWMDKNKKDIEEYDKKQIEKVAKEVGISPEETWEIYFKVAQRELKKKTKK